MTLQCLDQVQENERLECWGMDGSSNQCTHDSAGCQLNIDHKETPYLPTRPDICGKVP